MSLNTAHANSGVLIHSGEWILLFSDNVTMEFSGQFDQVFKGTKAGRIYLTTHRIIFNNKNPSDPMLSFSCPFVTLSDVDIEQPVFGANYIRGKVRAQPNGNWEGEVKFKLVFKSGGAIEFGQAMLRAAQMAQRNMHNDAPPPYQPPSGNWYEAPPPAYSPPPGYYGWIPTNVFPGGPPPNSVYMSDNPPPYPGIGMPQGNNGGMPPSSGGYSGPPQMGFAPPPGMTPNGYPGYPPMTSPQSGYPGQPPQQAGYPGGPTPNGYPGYPAQPGYPVGGGATFQGYPGPSGGGGATGPAPPPNSKEAEAAQSAYYDPNRPQTAYVPPPAYYEPPPSYDSVNKKKQ